MLNGEFMRYKLRVNIFCVLILLALVNNSSAQTATQLSGEYATDLTSFEYELTAASDSDGWLKFYWGFNNTGDVILFEIGTSVLSEDYEDVFFDGVYKIPMEIYINNEELDVNANSTYFNYWEGIFWGSFLLPIEDGQYNNFDVLEDQDPASYDVKGDEVSYFTSESEYIYDYNTGIAKSWSNSVSYDFTLSYIPPPEITDEVTSEEETGFLAGVPISTPLVYAALISLIFVSKLISNGSLKTRSN